MQGVKIPNYIAKEIFNTNRDFLWNNNMKSNNSLDSIPLILRDKECGSKCKGGLGIRNIQDVNTALLTKLRWKVHKEPNNLWVKVMSTKHLTKNDFLEAKKIS